jgi:hypothetical protein
MRTNGLAEDANGEVEGSAGVPQRVAPRPAVAPGPKRSSLLRSLALAGLVTLTAGCSGVTTLQSVLRPDGADATVEDIQVFRSGTPLTPELSMRLVAGDEIQTEADSTAIVRFANGTEVIVGPNTHIRIGSLWVLFGEIYVKARGRFRVETLYVTAGVEGTEYLLTVDSEAEMSMVVLDGAVRLTSKTGGWEPMALRKFEQGVFRPQEAPLMSRVDPVEGNRIMQAINQPVPQILGASNLAAKPPTHPAGIEQGPRTVGQPPAPGTGVVITPRPPGTGSGVVTKPGPPATDVGLKPPRPPEPGLVITPRPPGTGSGMVTKPTVTPPAKLPGATTVPPPAKLLPGARTVPPPAKLETVPSAGFRQRLLQQPPPSPR